MKIVIYGDAATEGSGGWCYAETLQEMGHAVSRVSGFAGLEAYAYSIPGRIVRRLLKRPLEIHRRAHVAPLLRAVEQERPEVVIVLKGLYISAEDVLRIRRSNAWAVIINHDDFFSANVNNWTPMQRRAVPHYDYVFTSREVNVQEVAPLNANVEFFPFAYYPRIHRPVSVPVPERDTWETDVVFVGTWEAERAGLMEELVRSVPGRYAIWGTGWERLSSRSPLVPYIRGRAAVMDDMAKALGGARIALAFLRKQNRDDYTQRTFEIPACGGVMLAERSDRHQRFYREGVEAEFFDAHRSDELIAKVKNLMVDPPRRESIRQAGRAALLAQRHTYRDRLERLLELHERFRHTRENQ
jgi:spore maturation protein CgeB